MGVAPDRPPSRRGLYLGATPAGPLIGGPEQGALILGPPRSGKTSALVIPNILGARGPVVSTSTKPDVMEATLAARARCGRCWVFDPTGSVAIPSDAEPLRWSPLRAAATWDGALVMSAAMVRAARPAVGSADAAHWSERAEALLAPLLYAAALAGHDMATVMGWVNRRDAHVAEAVLAGAASPIAGDLLAGIAGTEERERSGIWSTASGVLAAYRSETVLERTGWPNFDPVAFLDNPDTLYVCASGHHQAQVAPLVVGLIEEVRNATYARAASRDLSAPVLLALDEAANIAPLPDLPALAAEGGGQGLSLLVCLQDLSQARARWGPAADGFGSLFGSTVVLRGVGDVRTLQALSALCGEHDVATRSETRGRNAGRGRPGTSRSITWSTRRQARVPVDAIARGGDGQALVIGGGDPPAWVSLPRWWEAEPWRSLASGVAREAGRPAPRRWRRPPGREALGR